MLIEHILFIGGDSMENHIVEIENQKNIKVTDVIELEGFDENVIYVILKEKSLVIQGENLHINSLDEGILIAEGKIESVEYRKKKVRKTLKERFKR